MENFSPQNQNTEEEGSKINTPLFIVGIILVIAGGVLIFLVYSGGLLFDFAAREIGASPYGGSEISQLREGNNTASTAYNEARTLRRDLKEYDDAIARYEDALQLTQDATQRAQILFETAFAHEESDREFEAIRLFKQIAADPDVSDLLRASAVEHLGQIYFSRYDENIFNEIFTGSSYEGFLVVEDAVASIRNLFEHGVSIYPTAYMELRLANWYALDLLDGTTENIQNISTQEAMARILEKAGNADRDIARFQERYYTGSRVPLFYLRKAMLADKLHRLGNSTLGDPEELFKKAFQESKIAETPTTAAFALYHFAVYMAQNEREARAEDIRSVLQALMGSTYQSTALADFLRNARDSEERENIMLLASIDPSFKLFINDTYGWDL